jgi:peptide/nickel transport system ATP-binding protein
VSEGRGFEIRDLSVGYRASGGPKQVVKHVSLRVEPGRMLGLAGESGCGKSTTVLAATGYRVPGMVQRSGSALVGETDLLGLARSRRRRYWGRQIAYLPQDATTSLTPNRTVGKQFVEVLRTHSPGENVRARAVEMLEHVGLPFDSVKRYPFEFSGGQQQRLALAIALACRPAVLILDEPTTGLDVTTQATVSALILRLVRELGIATVYVSHDLALLRELCDEIAIMYAGEIVERAPAAALFAEPRHPYTAALLDAIPAVDSEDMVVPIPGLPPPRAVDDRCAFADRCAHVRDVCRSGPVELVSSGGRSVRCVRAGELGPHGSERRPAPPSSVAELSASDVLLVRGLSCAHGRGSAARTVVSDVSFGVRSSEILAVVGESGSGKSTLLRAIVGLHAPAAGEIRYGAEPLAALTGARDPVARREIQIVFQNPSSSLNPRHSVRRILQRPLEAYFPGRSRSERARRVDELLVDVQLDRDVLDRQPAELSGGQQQRVALARALAAEPRVVLCDEVVSALDVSVQAAIHELVRRLRDESGLTVVFVTHDLAVVRTLADRILVMQQGEIVERGATGELFARPEVEYTRELLDAAPRIAERRLGAG